MHSLVSSLGHGYLFDKYTVNLKKMELFLKKNSDVSNIAGSYVTKR
jgi:hypothetical protein